MGKSNTDLELHFHLWVNCHLIIITNADLYCDLPWTRK